MKFQSVPENTVVTGTFRRTPTAHELTRMAVLHPQLTTKKHAKLILRAHEFSANDAAIEALLDTHKAIAALHETRQKRKPASLRSAADYQKFLATRLSQLRYAAVKRAATACLRYGAAGGYSMRVTATDSPDAIGYKVEMDSNRNTYRGYYKGWSANEDHHRITVPRDWRLRVLKRGLATAGGMFTLSVQQLVSHGDIELFQAVWVEQGRGFSVTVRRGVIARLYDEVYHAESSEQAIRGVRRKTNETLGVRKSPRSSYAISTEDFVKRYALYADLPVTVQDAYNTGACTFGVNSWCASVGIDLSVEQEVPLSRLLTGFVQSPLIEVRRTVLRVVADHRARKRASTASNV